MDDKNEFTHIYRFSATIIIWSFNQFIIYLGYFSQYINWSISQCTVTVFKRSHNPMGRFEEHHGPSLVP